jgi:hypothetical protein
MSGKDLLVGDRVLIPDDQELLPCSTSWATYSRKREKGGLVTTMSASLRNATHSGLRKSPPGYLSSPFKGDPGGLVALEEELDVGHVRRAVAVLVLHMVEDDGERLGLLALAIPLVVFREQGELAGDGGAVVAGGDELLEAELVEVGGEVLEEVALEGVVAVAVDDLAAEGVGVELEVGLDLLLDVDVLGVELVLLGRLRGARDQLKPFAYRRSVEDGSWLVPSRVDTYQLHALRARYLAFIMARMSPDASATETICIRSLHGPTIGIAWRVLKRYLQISEWPGKVFGLGDLCVRNS